MGKQTDGTLEEANRLARLDEWVVPDYQREILGAVRDGYH